MRCSCPGPAAAQGLASARHPVPASTQPDKVAPCRSDARVLSPAALRWPARLRPSQSPDLRKSRVPCARRGCGGRGHHKPQTCPSPGCTRLPRMLRMFRHRSCTGATLPLVKLARGVLGSPHGRPAPVGRAGGRDANASGHTLTTRRNTWHSKWRHTTPRLQDQSRFFLGRR